MGLGKEKGKEKEEDETTREKMEEKVKKSKLLRDGTRKEKKNKDREMGKWGKKMMRW